MSERDDKKTSGRVLRCDEWEDLIADALDGTLSAADAAAFTRHHGECALCAQMFKEAQQGRAWMEYLAVEPDEIKNLRIATKDTLELSQFVDVSEIPVELYEKPYFVVPQDAKHAAAFAVIRKALEQTGKAGVGKIAFAGREHLVAIAPAADKKSRGLMAYTMRYENELRKPSEYFSEIAESTVDKKQLSMAMELINQYTAPFNPGEFKDDYEAALQKLIDAKRKNKPLPLEEEKKPASNVINLMDALRRSIHPEHEAKAKSMGRAKSSGKGPVLVKSVKRKSRVA